MSNELPFVRSVLHTTDFSPASHQAFAHALSIALLRQTELTLLHCGPESAEDIDWQAFPPVRETLINWGLLEPGSPKSALAQHLNMTVTKYSLKSQHPVLATARYLQHTPHDLVVLATEGRHGFERWVKRSSAEAISRWGRTNTLFVPSDARRGLIDVNNGIFTFHNILVAVDHTPKPFAAVELARRAADLLGEEQVKITLLHVGDTLPKLPAVTDGDRWYWQIDQRSGEPETVILNCAKDIQADLIVMTSAGVDSVLDAFRGNTSEQIVRRSECPVMVVAAVD